MQQQQQVKNREATQIQVTAEQLIYDARVQFGDVNDKPKETGALRIVDREELNEFLQRKRKEFEDRIRKHRFNVRVYLDYAQFEADQSDYRRMRSVLERAITVLASEVSLWMHYAELEAKAGYVQHALNVLERATQLLPREDTIWLKYALYVEVAETPDRTREAFERWVGANPTSQLVFQEYVKFEVRMHEPARARDVYERWCGTHPTCRTYIRYAHWESKPQNACAVFERAVGAEATAIPELPESELKLPDLWLAFGQFEAKLGEVERARAVYQHALERVSAESRGKVFAAFAAFEKRYNSEESASSHIIVTRRREVYEQAVAANPFDYDAWFDLCRLEESLREDVSRIRNVYARAEANSPNPASSEKRDWRRFVYFFIYEALFEELVANDVDRARSALARALDVIPHRRFTFGKIWIMAAHLELRCHDLPAARRLFGAAIGLCPKDKTFRAYIQLELQLGQVERCRQLYEKYLVWGTYNSHGWAKYADLERSLGEEKRARAIFELGVSQPVLDEPEKLWQRYIDFELASSDEEAQVPPFAKTAHERARALYERLVSRTEGRASKVWIAYAKFLAGGASMQAARDLLERAERRLQEQPALGDERAAICQARVELERSADPVDAGRLHDAEARLPRKVERRRGEEDQGVVEWLFPADVLAEQERAANDETAAKKAASLKMLAMAQKWKEQQRQQLQSQDA